MKNMISMNLRRLRKNSRYSQEEVADKLNVSRQAVAKWENGESMPDIMNCSALAALYNVTIDNLIHYDEDENGLAIPEKGKHMFGVVTVGDRGQIVIPKKAREIFQIRPGDKLLVLGDEAPERAGIAIVKTSVFMDLTSQLLESGGGDE